MDLSKLTEAQLVERQQTIGEARGNAERKFKADATAIQRELDRRAVTARVAAALDGISEDQRAAVLESLKGA